MLHRVLNASRVTRASVHRTFHSSCAAQSMFSRSTGFSVGKACQAPLLKVQKRFLDLHEYQSKDLATRFGVRVQKGYMAETADQTEAHAVNLLKAGAPELVLKAQIHAGGRGKGVFNTGFKGGVQFGTEPKKMRDFASKMFGNNLITKQTPPEGQTVKKVLVHESLNFDKSMPELYLAFLMDRSFGGPVMVASRQGGMDIEEVAARDPSAILKEPICITKGIQPEQTLKMAKALGFPDHLIADAQQQMTSLYSMFLKLDCTQIEINPMVVAKTREGQKVYCVDAKLNFDDNASFRQKEVFAMRDTSMEDPRDVAASENGLNYVGLDGNIGCMGNFSDISC
jgi:succinyl-CoA synthetase beta subunit